MAHDLQEQGNKMMQHVNGSPKKTQIDTIFMAGLRCLGLLCVIMSWIFLAIGFTSTCIVFNGECRYTHDDDFTQY